MIRKIPALLGGAVVGTAIGYALGFSAGVRGYDFLLESRYPEIHKELKYRMRTNEIGYHYEDE